MNSTEAARPYSPAASSSLSPHRRDRPSSRASSRASYRAPSPALNATDDPGTVLTAARFLHTLSHHVLLLLPLPSLQCLPFSSCAVGVRNQISALKHTIRHQQAQVHHLETVLSSSPRQPIMPNDLATMSRASPTPSLSSKMQRRTSFEVLQGIAGPDSNLPLPSRLNGLDDVGSGSIREGVPMSFGLGNSQSHLSPSKRTSSPTRTLSRE